MADGLEKKVISIVYQFSRFLGIGFLNTGVDFLVINLLIALTGVTGGLALSLLNAVSFTVAVVHSFYWNKFWTFSSVQETFWRSFIKVVIAGLLGAAAIFGAVKGAAQEAPAMYFVVLLAILAVSEIVLWHSFKISLKGTGREASVQLGLFLGVSVIGTIINSAVIGLITGFVPPMAGLGPRTWANAAKVLSTGVSLVWNFVGYKLLVFKK